MRTQDLPLTTFECTTVLVVYHLESYFPVYHFESYFPVSRILQLLTTFIQFSLAPASGNHKSDPSLYEFVFEASLTYNIVLAAGS